MKRALVSIALAGLLAAACSSEPPQLAGYVRTPAPNSAGLSLPDATAGGADFAIRAPSGGVLLVYFGYTACPDVCPTTLADIRTALADLGGGADRVSVAMVTVDPERDTGEILAAYVQSFSPGWHALRTTDEARLAGVADVLGAAYEVSVNDEGTVEVLHTAHVYAVADDGDLLVTWPFGVEPADITSDLRILLGR